MNTNLQKTLCNGILYGLKVDKLIYPIVDDHGYTIGSDEDLNVVIDSRTIKTALEQNCKPYLFSLDYLTKEIEFRGQRFVPIEMIETLNDDPIIAEWCVDHLVYGKGINETTPIFVVDQLRARMFNVDGLEEDQYIRVTEENNPYRI